MNMSICLLHAFSHYGGHICVIPVTPFLSVKIHCYINRTNVFKSTEIVHK